jgi:GSH-dependent disulfide-bond oxidoreductase
MAVEIMIELFYCPTPNGHKITLFLEEAGVPYTITVVDITRGAQFAPEFLALSPNNRIPAIIDRAPADGGAPVSVFESGAILLYLADKYGKFVPADLRGRTVCIEWLFWQMANLGPVAGENHHFGSYAKEKLPYAIDRFVRETTRLYDVLDRRLAGGEYICGDQYTIADMACYPWIVPHKRQQQVIADFPNLKRWFDAIRARPAWQRAWARGEEYKAPAQMSEETRRILFEQGRRPG